MTRVLMTSFEPFGGLTLNSSHEVAAAIMADLPDDLVLDWQIVPVVAGLCVRLVWERVESTRPDVIVALGQATGAEAVRLEDRGINLDDFSMPDNAGQLIQKQPIVPGGPDHLRTTAPLEELLRLLPRAGFPILHSLSAGSYVCNHLYYGLLHRASSSAPSPRVLFVHLPLLPGQVADKPSRPLDEMAATVRLVLRLVAAGKGSCGR